jgi:hypothetical protein
MLVDAARASAPATLPAREPSPPPETPAARLAREGDVAGASDLIRRDPTQIDAVLGAFAAERPGLVPDLVAASAATIERRPPTATAPPEEPSLGTRIWGGVRALGGALETVAGGALIVTPEPTMLTKAGGVALGAHGIDNIQAGVRQAISGREQDTLTQQGVEATAGALGADPQTARTIGLGVDIGIGFTGSGVAALSRLAGGSRMVWNSVRATQPLYEGTVIPRSFTFAAGSTNVWVHGNGTKHIAEYANAMLARGVAPELVNLTSQVQLTSLQAAVRTAGSQGIGYEQMMRVGGWELIFSAPRAGQALPVLKHALPIR